MKTMLRQWIGAGAVVLLFSGCAVGQKYNLTLADPRIELSGRGPIAVAVLDQRLDIIDGKEASIAGLVRGGWGNPFYTFTTSGRPLAADMVEIIKRSLEKSGFNVTTVAVQPAADHKPALLILKQHNLEKALLLVFKVWRPDLGSGGNLGLSFDLKLYVLGAQGQVLAEAADSGNEHIGVIRGFSGIFERYEEYTVAAFKAKIEALFNRPEILASLH